MIDQLPLFADLRVSLAGPSLPVKILLCLLVPPERVHINHRERSVALGGHQDFQRPTMVVDQIARFEKLLPTLLPTPTVKTPLGEDPIDRIMGMRGRRPRPYHVGMKNRYERLCILRIPGLRLVVYHFLDFSLHFDVSICLLKLRIIVLSL